MAFASLAILVSNYSQVMKSWCRVASVAPAVTTVEIRTHEAGWGWSTDVVTQEPPELSLEQELIESKQRS